jgi:preprotein translocase subunit YajC
MLGLAILIQVFVGVIMLGVLVYLIIRRNKIRKQEDFEKRSN